MDDAAEIDDVMMADLVRAIESLPLPSPEEQQRIRERNRRQLPVSPWFAEFLEEERQKRDLEYARFLSRSPEEQQQIRYTSWRQWAFDVLKACRSPEEQQLSIDFLRHEASFCHVDISRTVDGAIESACQELGLQVARHEADEHITVIQKARDDHFAPSEAPERGSP